MWITAKHITFKKRRMIIDIQLNAKPYYSNAAIKSAVIGAYPTIVNHNCKNVKNANLKDVLDSTSIPHLIEHIIIDIQAQKYAEENREVTLFGTTEWVNENLGLSQIQLSYEDDVVALSALKQALEFFNSFEAKNV